jgi:hypothetical protein
MVTSDRSWHWKFEEQIRHSADLGLYDASSQAELEPCYREITGNFINRMKTVEPILPPPHVHSWIGCDGGISEPATRPDIPRRLRGVYCP